jgi:heme iron utilization protein
MAPDRAEASLAIRRLLRATRAATLATQSDGQPFASLVTPATAPDLAVLMLLSGLSEHTRHLRAEPRCALMALGPALDANPQTAPRVTVTGIAAPVEDEALKSRWLALHPYAALYAGFGDFALWRMQPLAALYVGGFARAIRLGAADLAPDPAAVAAIAASAEGIISHCNADHADAMARLAGEPELAWRMVAVDVDGCDLASGDRVRRIDWAAPVRNAGEVRAELIRQLARPAAV